METNSRGLFQIFGGVVPDKIFYLNPCNFEISHINSSVLKYLVIVTWWVPSREVTPPGPSVSLLLKYSTNPFIFYK